MANFATVAQMYEQALTPVKGWFDMSALDKMAPLHATILASATSIPAGRVANIASTGVFTISGYTGTGGTAAPSKEMPIFLWQGNHSTDVSNSNVSSVTGVSHWYGISPSGTMSGLVATGGYELQTTEFVTANSYAVNDLLTTVISSDLSLAGKLSNKIVAGTDVVQYVNYVVGIASTHCNQKVEDYRYDATLGTGVYAGAAPGALPTGYNAHGVLTLTFWTYFLPAGTAATID